jgi:predicted membrane-bound spermidine synthase
MNRSSVEVAIKSHSWIVNVTTMLPPIPSERFHWIADALENFDIVKIDLPDMLSILRLSHVESQLLFAYSIAKIIHIEFHVCDHTSYLDLRDAFISIMELFQYYGYEIYHKEVTFVENLIQEKAGENSTVCHVGISWIKM